VAGLDEAGRGCLFGPVYAAAVILHPERRVEGLQDSKQLSAERREELSVLIRSRADAWAVGWADSREIDCMNIYQASRLAMKRALEKIEPPADYLLVDALTLDTEIPQQALIRGDARCESIAAASILAKVDRDAAMQRWDRRHPEYGFGRHKGYGTPEHLRALHSFGPLPDHRRSFSPVRKAAGLPPVSRQPARRPIAMDDQLGLFGETTSS